MKLYYKVSQEGNCFDKCDKHKINNPYYQGVRVGSKACQSCDYFNGSGIDLGGDYIHCTVQS